MRNILLLLGLLCLATEARAEWWRAETANFVIQAEMSETELRRLAVDLETLDGLMRSLSGAVGKPVKHRSDILLFDDRTHVRRLTGIKDFSGGLTIATAEGELVLATAGDKAESWRDPRNSVFHEYAHSFMRRHMGSMFPGWFIEGYASYFQTAEVLPGGTVQIGAMPLSIIEALSGGLGFADVMTISANRKGGPAPVKVYAEGWLLAHYYFSGGARVPEIRRYVYAANAGDPVDKPEIFFAGGIAALDKDMAAYLKAGPGAKTLSTAPADPNAIRIRAMREGEVRLATLRLEDLARAQAGSDRDASPTADAYVRLVAARPILDTYPDEIELIRFVARLAVQSGEEKLAATLADKLLATAPDDPDYLALKAEALTVDARAHPARAPALLKEGRALLTRAAGIDPDNPAVAAALYRNYSVDQGASPETRRHLARAVKLNPDDIRLMITAIDFAMRARDGKYAIALLTPIANSPHDTPGKRLAIETIAEIKRTMPVK